VKTTIDLPDDLVTEIKIEAARQHRKLNDLVPELLRDGLQVQRLPSMAKVQDGRGWLDAWLELGRAATAELPDHPTASELLAADRNRLERAR
jgi:plasmid stability protein